MILLYQRFGLHITRSLHLCWQQSQSTFGKLVACDKPIIININKTLRNLRLYKKVEVLMVLSLSKIGEILSVG